MFKGPIALGTVRTSFALGLRLFIQAGTLLLVARMLGPDDFGVFAGVSALAVLCGTLSTFGTNLVLFGEVAKNSGNRNLVLAYALPTTFLCSAFMLGLYLIASSWLAKHSDVTIVILIAIGLTEVVLQPFFGLMAVEHHALGRVARAQLLLNFPLVLRMLAAALISVMSLTPALYIYSGGYLIASILALGLGALCLPERLPNWRQWRFPAKRERHKSLGYAFINISKAAPAELDKALAMKLLSLDAAGMYAAGARVVGAITLPVTAMTLSALPRLFREYGAQAAPAKGLLRWMYGVALAYSLLLASALWFVAPALATLFGEGYEGMTEAIRWLCLAIPGISARWVAGNILMAQGSPWERVFFEATGIFALILSSIIFVRYCGVIGMPLSVVFSEWVMAIVGGFIVMKSKLG